MTREARTEYTLICGRCKSQKIFSSESKDDIEEHTKWQCLNTSFLPFFGRSFDLCPECFEAFKKEFMDWLPPAFREAFDKEK